jgi:hypothetical protein|tara:strand:+ start:340 stop:468 length:129 start_codon:yes stop_codon:yes gene_type:complete
MRQSSIVFDLLTKEKSSCKNNVTDEYYFIEKIRYRKNLGYQR